MLKNDRSYVKTSKSKKKKHVTNKISIRTINKINF